ncbi:hypothetical protein CDAR_590681 [Caerostris darwini]|uniref:Uncharacterized protein n=1 Tax=Caerostris darwini TaxID=1538125 RepID=A0AAV4UCG0_9ARAC|nr:hypothetical protein CDAR_590681 [Caerostris darwini]
MGKIVYPQFRINIPLSCAPSESSTAESLPGIWSFEPIPDQRFIGAVGDTTVPGPMQLDSGLLLLPTIVVAAAIAIISSDRIGKKKKKLQLARYPRTGLRDTLNLGCMHNTSISLYGRIM